MVGQAPAGDWPRMLQPARLPSSHGPVPYPRMPAEVVLNAASGRPGSGAVEALALARWRLQDSGLPPCSHRAHRPLWLIGAQPAPRP